jgi:hypothetical protein
MFLAVTLLVWPLAAGAQSLPAYATVDQQAAVRMVQQSDFP